MNSLPIELLRLSTQPMDLIEQAMRQGEASAEQPVMRQAQQRCSLIEHARNTDMGKQATETCFFSADPSDTKISDETTHYPDRPVIRLANEKDVTSTPLDHVEPAAGALRDCHPGTGSLAAAEDGHGNLAYLIASIAEDYGNRNDAIGAFAADASQTREKRLNHKARLSLQDDFKECVHKVKAMIESELVAYRKRSN